MTEQFSLEMEWKRSEIQAMQPIYLVGSPADSLYRVIKGFVADYPRFEFRNGKGKGYGLPFADLLHSSQYFGVDVFRSHFRESQPIALVNAIVERVEKTELRNPKKVCTWFRGQEWMREKLDLLKGLTAERSCDKSLVRLASLLERHSPYGENSDNGCFLPFNMELLTHSLGIPHKRLVKALEILESRGLVRLEENKGIYVKNRDTNELEDVIYECAGEPEDIE